MQRLFGDSAISPARVTWLVRVLAASGLTLVAVTWRLWVPGGPFPQVPLVGAMRGVPDEFQWLALAAIVTGLIGALIVPAAGRWRSASIGLFAAGMLASILFDQHRLQPWAYQFLLFGVVLATCEPRAAFALLRMLIVSFYFYSAVTKLDYSFLHTLGQQFLATVVHWFGGSPDDWDLGVRQAAVAVFPIGELLIALGLLWARTRKAAVIAAVFLHIALIAILGPWGLNHRWGVLAWNAYFIVQDLLLFWNVPAKQTLGDSTELTSPAPARTPLAAFATGVIVAAMVLPLLAPWSWFDLWPSWGLYASSAERVTLLVHRLGVEELSDTLRPYVALPSDPADPWAELRLDLWSLDEVAAPIYPQARFQLGVADAVIQQQQLSSRARVVRQSLADRWTGERTYDALTCMSQVAEAQDGYWFNARPRRPAAVSPR